MVDSAWSNESWLRPLLTNVLGQEPIASVAADGKPLWEAVVASGLLTDERLLAIAAAHLRISVADLRDGTSQARTLLPERWARRYRVLPLRAADGAIEVATADPVNLDCERALSFATGRSVRLSLASPLSLTRALDAAYRDEPSPAVRLDVQHLGVDVEVAPTGPDDTEDNASISRLVDEVLGEGIAAHASDIHIEPEERGIVVRHRIDGMLRPVRTLPRSAAQALVSRLKILCGLDIADRLRPQDGRARVALNGVAVDLRVSTLPASHGEKVAIRVLDARGAVRALDAMGFNDDELRSIETLIESREGLILVTGPTGSGKTTTLYAALRRLQERGLNIVTVEDPIEYRLPGIVQVQVNERAGLTFAAALRSIMRQDPDVLLIGEIRDRETAEIAIQASLTGHLVFSTLHTNDAASAVTRLVDIGVLPYKIATALKGVLAQRLVRRLCTCGSASGRRDRMVAEPPAVTCAVCGGEGFRGRLAIVEVLRATPAFERAVADGQSTERLAETARQAGMRSLWDSGMAHVEAGRTSRTELLRVAAPAARVDAASQTHYLPSHTPNVERMDQGIPVRVATVDVYVVRPIPGAWQVLLLQRGADTRCPASWETVHGRIEPGERPEDAALREVREETGIEPTRLYTLTVQPFYLPIASIVTAAVVFVAFTEDEAVSLGTEHEAFEWLPVEDAMRRFSWPRSRTALREAIELLGEGHAGAVEDVLRVK
jgi:type II secretory ATPase GspE/PulE/Tfp pilus assembly ATPase PilB-like protein/8-oxo-dGTP pyrophosphatase MutT (NUDIX family)